VHRRNDLSPKSLELTGSAANKTISSQNIVRDIPDEDCDGASTLTRRRGAGQLTEVCTRKRKVPLGASDAL
jgi:hypothetical protein